MLWYTTKTLSLWFKAEKSETLRHNKMHMFQVVWPPASLWLCARLISPYLQSPAVFEAFLYAPESFQSLGNVLVSNKKHISFWFNEAYLLRISKSFMLLSMLVQGGPFSLTITPVFTADCCLWLQVVKSKIMSKLSEQILERKLYIYIISHMQSIESMLIDTCVSQHI